MNGCWKICKAAEKQLTQAPGTTFFEPVAKVQKTEEKSESGYFF